MTEAAGKVNAAAIADAMLAVADAAQFTAGGAYDNGSFHDAAFWDNFAANLRTMALRLQDEAITPAGRALLSEGGE